MSWDLRTHLDIFQIYELNIHFLTICALTIDYNTIPPFFFAVIRNLNDGFSAICVGIGPTSHNDIFGNLQSLILNAFIDCLQKQIFCTLTLVFSGGNSDAAISKIG